MAYLAPEMIKRKGHGKSMDWYMCGILLYEMLTGDPPFLSTNKQKMFNLGVVGVVHVFKR